MTNTWIDRADRMDFSLIELYIEEEMHLIKGLRSIAECAYEGNKNSFQELQNDCSTFCIIASEKLEQIGNELCNIQQAVKTTA